jgi:hypothetical protein
MNELTDQQLPINGEYMYLDVDKFVEQIEIVNKIDESTDINLGMEINLPKFEFFKIMIEVLLGYAEEVDDKLGTAGMDATTLPFRLAMNTLIEYEILKKCK